MIKILTKEAIKFNKDLGGLGVRDNNLLNSALNSAFQSAFGEDLFPTIIDKASRICFGIIKNHPFVDGNKRTGIHCMMVFLYVNSVSLQYTQSELVNLSLSVADGSVSQVQLKSWIEVHVEEIK